MSKSLEKSSRLISEKSVTFYSRLWTRTFGSKISTLTFEHRKYVRMTSSNNNNSLFPIFENSLNSSKSTTRSSQKFSSKLQEPISSKISTEEKFLESSESKNDLLNKSLPHSNPGEFNQLDSANSISSNSESTLVYDLRDS